MSGELPKPMASLGAGLLGRRAPARRVPLSFAPLDAEPGNSDLPEVILQVERLALALGIDATEQMADDGPRDGPADAYAAPRRRIAFTLRFDPVRHGQLRQLAGAQARSAQLVLIEAFDRYLATQILTPCAIPLPRNQRPTGNQP